MKAIIPVAGHGTRLEPHTLTLQKCLLPVAGAKRISIQNTRSMITAILDGSIEHSDFEVEPIFSLECPKNLTGVNSDVLNPRSAWDNPDAYDRQAEELVELFLENFKIYGDAVSYLEHAGPRNQSEIAI